MQKRFSGKTNRQHTRPYKKQRIFFRTFVHLQKWRIEEKDNMQAVIDRYRNIIVQIATPYSKGTGFYLSPYHIIVTNEHVVRDNKEVVIEGKRFARQLTPVLFLDEKYDLAFLRAPDNIDLPEVEIGGQSGVQEGDTVLAVGHPLGLSFTFTQGIISNKSQESGTLSYIQHDAALNPGNSGGPLIDAEGRIIGVNTFIIKDGQNIGFSLPVNYLKQTIEAFQAGEGELGLRCASCMNIIFEQEVEQNYCPHCGAKVVLPSTIEEYEATGISKTIEEMLERSGHHVGLSRRGPNNWEIREGSAKILISYHEDSGLIVGDAYLCLLPRQNIKPIYEFLLRQNAITDGLTFSINPQAQDIILSLLIYDRYLNVDVGIKLFQHLFERADYYDNVLVEEYGAYWKEEQ